MLSVAMNLLYWAVLVVIVLLVIYSGFPGLLYGIVVRFERFRAGWTERTIQIDGHPIFYLDSGSDAAPDRSTVLMVHGFAGDRDNWDRFAAHVPRRYRRLALDLPGFGASLLGSPDETVLSEQGERLRLFLDALKIDRVHILGCSMGGHLVAHFAVKHPRYVRSLLLFDPSGIEEGRRSEQFRLLEEKGMNCLAPVDAAGYDRMMSMLFTKQPFIPGSLKKYLALLAIAHADFFEKAWRVVFYDRYEPLEPVLPALHKSGTPVQIYWGDDDRIIDVASLPALRRALPEAEVHVFESCGHLPFLEEPKRAARLAVDFLDRIEKTE